MAITVPVPIDPAPVVPNSSEDTVIFDVKQEDFYRYEKDKLQPGMNALAEAGYQNALSALDSATAAASSASSASASALSSAGSSNFKGDWATLAALAGPLNRPASVAHAGRTWLLLADLANVATATPADGSAYWRAYDTVFPVVPVNTATVTLVAGYEYEFRYAGKVTATMPAMVQGSAVVITVCNGRRDNVLLRASPTDSFMGKTPDDITLVTPGRFALRALFNSWRGF